MRNPFRKNPAVKAIDDMKVATINNFQSQLSSAISNLISGTITGVIKKKFTTILGGKTVEVVTPDPKKEEKEQDEEYARAMAMMNGDPDTSHYTPEDIDIHAFENDQVTPEEREEIYNIIDAINEANGIRREGKFRTEESVRQEDEEAAERAKKEMKETNNGGFLTIIAKSLEPIMSIMVSMGSTMLTLALLSKMSVIIRGI